MKHFFVEERTLPEAYHKALCILHDEGKIYPCEDQDSPSHMKEVSMMFSVLEPFGEPMISKLYVGGHRELQSYTMELTQGILDFKIGQDKCWEYTYSQRLLPWLPFIYKELRRNKFSRRAVIAIRNNETDSTNANPACLQSILFNVRDDRLHMTVLFRSNDAVQAVFMNCVGLIYLQKLVADELGYPVGTYTHIAESFHAYERSFDLLNRYYKSIKESDIDEITYEYEGFYKDMMKEEIPNILASVEELKARS
jgi:thymidylate synthase